MTLAVTKYDGLERIWSAAIRYNNAIWWLPRPNRHHHIIAWIHRRYPVTIVGEQQGFYTSFGRFVDRAEAMRIAIISGQLNVEPPCGFLTSEDLW